MNIIVCIKQVPGSNKVKVNPETGVLIRDGADTKMNPYDLYAIETAVQLKEQCGGTVKVITMGPFQAEEVIREAFAMGADEGYLLTDRKFAGADVLATSYALAQGVKMMGGYDLIITGKQTTDGDTAQVGPEMAERLDLPSIANVTKIIEITDRDITVEMETPTAIERSKVSFPCLLSVEKDILQPRLPSYVRMKATKDVEIKRITFNDLEDKNEKHYGLSGSPTQVQKIFPPDEAKDRELWTGTDEELADKMLAKLKERKFI
ncbi:MAG: electron transfer flavoprotein subunit beta/FixA family protein [Clostridia bacterium]|nr:electron transfer flavoprotein subunit beta/FixA family protein [Clostridia bacterium]